MFPVLTSTTSSHTTHAHPPHTHSHPSHTHPHPHGPLPPAVLPESAPLPTLSTSSLASYHLVHKAGFLTKEGEVWKTWKRRYFVLSSLLLSYYVDRESTVPKGVIPLDRCEVRLSERTERPNLFEVFDEAEEGKRRVYFLQADSEKERDEWVAAIKNNILLELNRARAYTDEVDGYKAEIQRLKDQIERIHAKQVLAEMNAGSHSSTVNNSSPVSSSFTSSTSVDSGAAALQSRVSYLNAEVDRLQAENRSLKRAALAMQGKGDEMEPFPSAAVGEEAGGTSTANVVGQGEDVVKLKAELGKVRNERAVLKREVLRLMALNEQLSKARGGDHQGGQTQQKV